jgi:23S rRNA (uracil1939-C5)-methyltransferase
MIAKGNILEKIEITGIGSEGKAVGRFENLVVFVEDAVPGDVADVLIFKKKKNFAEGRAVNIHISSPDRKAPACEHFGTCGGCKWQHLSYEKQLAFKSQQVVDAFERIGKLELPEISPIIGSAQIYHYRNKMEYTFSNRSWLTRDEINSGADPNNPALGFHVPFRYDKILDITNCHLQDDIGNKIRNEVRKYCVENGIKFFDLISQEGEVRNLIIRSTSTGQWMVLVVFHQTEEKTRIALLDHLKEKFPFITSLLYIINVKRNDTIFDQKVYSYYGKEFIVEVMENISFRISAKSFFQTNSLQAYELYKVVRKFAALGGIEHVYDLYTGTGTIASFVASQSKKVTGIDYIEDAIIDARQNAKDNNISNTTFYSGDIKDLLNSDFIEKNGKPDVIITDPPRAGMHEDVVRSILKACPVKIVYVSCNPSTQARDLLLMQEEYRISEIQPVDMFPHTSHVENVVLMIKK